MNHETHEMLFPAFRVFRGLNEPAVAHQGRVETGRMQIHAAHMHPRLHRREVDAVYVHHFFGARKLGSSDSSSEVVAAAERDVQAELLVEQEGTARLDAEVREHAEAQFGDVSVCRFPDNVICLETRRLARTGHPQRGIPVDFVNHHLVTELNRQVSEDLLGSPSISPS